MTATAARGRYFKGDLEKRPPARKGWEWQPAGAGWRETPAGAQAGQLDRPRRGHRQ